MAALTGRVVFASGTARNFSRSLLLSAFIGIQQEEVGPKGHVGENKQDQTQEDQHAQPHLRPVWLLVTAG